jgi:ribosomal protein L18E
MAQCDAGSRSHPHHQSKQAIAKLKHLLRKAAERTKEAVWRRIGSLLDHFTPQECENYIRNTGYGSA